MTDKQWYQGDPIPWAFDPCKSDREERQYDLALSDPNRCFGKGIEEDPLVVWINGPDYLDRDMIWAHNSFAKAIAKILGFTHTWIIKDSHDRQYARDAEGRRIPISDDHYLLEDADMHITMRLGTGLYECRLAVHAYVLLDKKGNPREYMNKLTRRFMKSGGDPQIELWPWRNYRRRFLPRRPIDLGTNWEIHANVGPYLDTYRPNERRTGDTYTPRQDSTPRRMDTQNEDGIIDGVMSRELADLVKQCNSAYDVYKAFHEDLASMEHPPLEKLRELHAMREQIVTMKREIRREAQGLLE
ncbi:hypothetical protein F5Y19DRAFT_479031 [Xylariaceae sp. FL1651]|nr:hypothetical protein F5Y19DRAFT_479031 [Xylariaceae sp. FL1651]